MFQFLDRVYMRLNCIDWNFPIFIQYKFRTMDASSLQNLDQEGLRKYIAQLEQQLAMERQLVSESVAQ